MTTEIDRIMARLRDRIARRRELGYRSTPVRHDEIEALLAVIENAEAERSPA